MTTAEKLYEALKGLPEPAIAELLDFAEFLRTRKLREKPQTKNDLLIELQGGLENSATFADTPLSIQKRLRDEWN